MRYSKLVCAAAALVCASAALASVVWNEVDSDVLVLGEIHDNPEHHARQTTAINQLQPTAVVFEMLTPDEAQRLEPVTRTAQAMRDASVGFHWSNIADYADILASSPHILGAAMPRGDVRRAFADGAAAVFGDDAADYGLKEALPADQLEARKTLQFEAHCEAMPRDMMGGMVEAQRLRDAAFARAVLEALDTYGAPVVLIAGNGHARMDWGVPAFLTRVRPDLKIASVGQGENWQDPGGVFNFSISDAAPVDRPDPCAAFRQ